jgi:hypothetical protein
MQVSACDLASGIWYLSVETKPGTKLAGQHAIPFEITATFGEANVYVGQVHLFCFRVKREHFQRF